MQQKSIVHMDLDTFFVSVERVQNSALYGKPILIGGKGDRGVVASCSYEARQYGISSAMPMKMALQLCPEATVIRGDTEQYTRYSELVTDIIKEQVPMYEKTSIDEFYIDLTGMDRFFGCFSLASELRQRIESETGLPISFGLSTSKTVSKVATGEAKPHGQMKINTGLEKPFLAPLLVKKIPMVGDKTYQKLVGLGIKKVATVQQMPLELMENVMGKMGNLLWKRANGIDNSPVIPYSERKSMSTEQTFSKDTIDVHRLQSILIGMTERLAFKLRSEDKLTACITIKVRYSNFDTYTQQLRIPYTSSDHILIGKAKELLHKLYQKRLKVRLIGVRFSHFVHGGYQINLFEDTEEMINLYQAMDKMNKQFGKGKIQRAVGMGLKHRDFNPFNGVRS
jgi:DNA polymerase-4